MWYNPSEYFLVKEESFAKNIVSYLDDTIFHAPINLLSVMNVFSQEEKLNKQIDMIILKIFFDMYLENLI